MQIAVGVALHGRLGEQGAVDQRGMVELVGKDRRVDIAERGEQREVGQVAGSERQRTSLRNARREPVGQVVFELGVGARMTADEVRGAAARAEAPRAVGKRLDELRVVGQAEVVVAAEAE